MTRVLVLVLVLEGQVLVLVLVLVALVLATSLFIGECGYFEQFWLFRRQSPFSTTVCMTGL